jgi:hypothetical protein
MIDGYEVDGLSAQQAVIAVAVGGRFGDELQRFRDLQYRYSWRLGSPMQQVHNVRAAGHLLIECSGAGFIHSVDPVDRHHREDLDELPITVAMLGQFLAQPCHAGGQIPVLERRSVAQCAGLAL